MAVLSNLLSTELFTNTFIRTSHAGQHRPLKIVTEMMVNQSLKPINKNKIMVRETESHLQTVPNGCSAHQALAPIIFFGQIFSLMPISGYFRSSPTDLQFSFKSLRFVYTFVSGCIIVSIMIMFLVYLSHRGTIGVGGTATFIYYAIVLTAMVEFAILAHGWPSIMQRWTEQERPFLFYPYETGKCLPLDSLVKRVAFAVILFAFIEDTMNFISAYRLNAVHMMYCSHAKDFWRNFFRREHAHIVRIIPYHPALGLAIEVMMRVGKFTWHYVDVFIICVSLALQRRFQQFNDRIRTFNDGTQPQQMWHDLRLDFLRLSELVAFLDTKMSRIILLSCANDMFFISMQLYNIFDPKPTIVTTFYYWYSLVFLISRCFAMLYVTSSIHEASLKPLELLRNISTYSWNLDLQRLLDHASLKIIAFSGKRFFFITRPLILAMAGTIITYELVLLDQVTKDQDTIRDCDF